MYPLIVCYCGREIGSLYDLYVAMRGKRVVEKFGESGIDPDVAMFAPDLQVETGDILDALGLHLDCCRGHMITQVTFFDEYGR
jgi:DNA-directed RNA polymerase subunit N (RpoN/RPB10)